MSAVRKYAGLPDLDEAPDIFETPDLTDDTSSHPTSTTVRSESPIYDPIDEGTNGIDRHRINPDEARTHFLPNGERDPAPSGRISSKQKSYRSSSRRRRKDSQDIINGIEFSSDGEEESLERKLARLRKEVAEVNGEFERRKAEKTKEGTQQELDSLDTLSKVLESVEPSTADGERSAAARFTNQLSRVSSLPVPKDERDNQTNANGTLLPTSTADDQTISTVSTIADFDARLNLLETALGIDTLPLPTQDRALPKAVLPTLDTLDQQLATLTTTTPKSLDTLTTQVRKLSQEAETLEQKRKDAKRALDALSPRPSSLGPASNADSVPKPDIDLSTDAEAIYKINALYGTLSTIESLAPLLPSVLDRLRSLRVLHADAATASQSLTEVERRQEEMKEELRGWREGLEMVERAVGEGKGRMKGNTAVVEGWVQELEGRVGKLV